jgi:cell division transport system permease protein
MNEIKEKNDVDTGEEVTAQKANDTVPAADDTHNPEHETYVAKNKTRKKYDILYFLELSLKSIWNNIGMALASLFVLASCLVVLGTCFLILMNINVNLEKFGSLNQIVVYCEYDAEDADILVLGDKLSALPNVLEVTHVTKEESFENFLEEYYSARDILAEIYKNGDQPLSDSFNILYEDNNYVGELMYNIAAIDGVRKVSNRADLAIKFENFKNGITLIFISFFVILLVTGFFVIVNTIKMSLHSRRYDIVVMKYIGATNAFILSPFILEGAIHGVIAASVASTVLHGLYGSAIDATSNVFGSIIEIVSINDYAFVIWLVFLVVGVLCGLLGSIFSISKNLNA